MTDETEDDLYGDLEEASNNALVNNLKTQISALMQEKKSMSADLEEYKSQIKKLVHEKTELEKNIVSLYNTALNELERKDKLIADLQICRSNMSEGRKEF